MKKYIYPILFALLFCFQISSSEQEKMLTKKVREIIQNAKMAHYAFTQDNILWKFTVENISTLTVSDAINLASASHYANTQDNILRKFYRREHYPLEVYR